MPRNSPQEMFLPARQRVPKGCGLCGNPLPVREMWGVPWLTTSQPATMGAVRRGGYPIGSVLPRPSSRPETIIWMMYLCRACFQDQPENVQRAAIWKPFDIWYATTPYEPRVVEDGEPWEARLEREAAERRYERAVVARARGERLMKRRKWSA